MFKQYTTAIEVLDDDKELIAKVEAFDEHSATVKVDTVFTSESWRMLSDKVYESLVSMELKR